MIEFKDIYKSFSATEVLQGVSFAVPEGSIVSLIGPNGSGKSTLLRILLQLETATSGEALINGETFVNFTKHHDVGISLDSMNPHPSRRAIDHLRWIAATKGVGTQTCYELLEFVGLKGSEGQRIKRYSLGMKQRLRIATALLGDPKLLILDEPVNGLDPEGILWLRDFLVGYCSKGNTVLITSHLMNELEQLATVFVFLRNGAIVEQLTRESLRDKYNSLEQAYFKLIASESEV